MKKAITLLSITMLVISAQAQNLFKVISVNGEIVAVGANVVLQNGLEVSSDDNFNFIVPQSRAAMINSELGRVILTEQNADEAFSRAAFAPAMSSISTRGASVSTSAEFKSIFSDNMLIIEKLEIKVGSHIYPMSKESFFYISYMHNDETINKSLPFNDDVLMIDMEDLFKVDGNSIDDKIIDNFRLFYYKKANIPESTHIADFSANFLESGQIKPEVKIIVDELDGKPFEKIVAEVHHFLKDFYGNPDRSNLETWIKKEFNLTSN